MPAHTAKQYGLFQAARKGKLRGPGPSPEVAEEMIHKTSTKKRSEFAKKLAKRRMRLPSLN